MIKEIPLILLASKSPRRKKILEQAGLNYILIDTIDIDETISFNENPEDAVKRLSLEKLTTQNLENKSGIVLTADTIVVFENEILGKPNDETDAYRMLKKLSNHTHKVYTGFTLFHIANNKIITDFEITEVSFRNLCDFEIEKYIKSGSPMDKAGAYGIQDDFGSIFVEKINGCFYNVVGLPISKVYRRLMETFE